jgi:hypothetical protein
MTINYNDVIKSIGENQHEILYNILKLYNNGEDCECDPPTYSKGGFYNQSKEFVINPPKYKFDVYPIVDGVEKIEPLGKFPLDDNSIQSINIDLPFVISVGPSLNEPYDKEKKNNIIHRRFTGYYPVQTMFESYSHFLEEAFRVLKPGGICVFKTQRTISGSITYLTPEYSWLCASQIGFYTLDRFTLLAKSRLISGKIKKQQHSRSFDSQFYVFQKPTKGTFQPVNYFKWKN